MRHLPGREKASRLNLSTTKRKGKKRKKVICLKWSTWIAFVIVVVLLAFHFVVEASLKLWIFLLSLLDAEVTGLHHHSLHTDYFCWWKCLGNACAAEKRWFIPVKAPMARLCFRVCSHSGFHVSVGDNYIVTLGGERSVGPLLLQQFSPVHLSKALSWPVYVIAVLTCGIPVDSDLCCTVVLDLHFNWDFGNGSLDCLKSFILAVPFFFFFF